MRDHSREFSRFFIARAPDRCDSKTAHSFGPTLRLLLAGILCQSSLCATPLAAQEPIYYNYPTNPGKPQPLKWSVLPSWLSFDGELRGRMEGQTSVNLVPSNDRIYVLTRVRGGIKAQPFEWMSGYLQFQDTHALGLPLPQVIADQRNTFDLFQGFVDLHMGKLGLITGRQMLKYGGERVVGVSDWTNNSRSWDGFVGHYGKKDWLEAFATSVVTTHPTSLDKHGAGLTFYGVTGLLATVLPQTQIQPFLFFTRNRSVVSQQQLRGGELETTFGAEVNGDTPGRLHYDLLGVLQQGAYSNNSIHSGAGYVKVSYQTKRVPWRPRIGGEYDYATGNPHRNPHRIGTYDQLYPSNHNAFGLVDLLGFRNITESRINVDLRPAKNLTLLLQTEFLHVASVRDNVYGSSDVLVKALGSGFAHNDIGQGLDVSSEYLFDDGLGVQIGVGHFFPGRVMAEGGQPSPLTLGYFHIDYRFKANKR